MGDSQIYDKFRKVEELLANQKPSLALQIIENLQKEINPVIQKRLYAKSFFWKNLCHIQLNNWKESSKAFENGISLFTELGDFVEVSKLYRDRGLAFESRERFDKSLEYYHKSIDELRDNNVVDALGITYSKLGQSYFYKNDLNRSLYYSDLGYKICKECRNSFFLLSSILPLTSIFIKLKEYKLALELIDEGYALLKIINKENGFKNTRRESELLIRKILVTIHSESESKVLRLTKDFVALALEPSNDIRNVFIKSYEFKQLYKYLEENKLIAELELFITEKYKTSLKKFLKIRN